MSAGEWRYVRVQLPGLPYDGVCGRVTGWTRSGSVNLIEVGFHNSRDTRRFWPDELVDITEDEYWAYHTAERSGQG